MKFDPGESIFLIEGFKNGFDLGYRGLQNRQDQSDNISLCKEVWTPVDLWDKMIKEVQMHRFAEPFRNIPYRNYIQSPVRVVPKSGNKSRLIFHISYDFKSRGKSINHHIPTKWCSVKYRDLNHVVGTCLRILKQNPGATLWFEISDLKSAFRLIPLVARFWPYLIMKARDPITNQWRYFVDKCLPFGPSISCAIFQCFSNTLAHILKHKTKYIMYKGVSNYLDDFLNVATLKLDCDKMLNFHQLCEWLGVPLAQEKIIWGTTRIIFLGILLDGKLYILALPREKIEAATYQLRILLGKKKATVKESQKMTGLLNLLHRAYIQVGHSPEECTQK